MWHQNPAATKKYVSSSSTPLSQLLLPSCVRMYAGEEDGYHQVFTDVTYPTHACMGEAGYDQVFTVLHVEVWQGGDELSRWGSVAAR